ncbi:MmyB family transcriptional regulator [Zhihengliuella sp. ISTPL4]|uniref:MmyB family transcriptional regulator n=1 Tax=Zhihengliuella sp. ISTPL4 TaxID=2058657 RepID=UPI000C79DCB4|nr:hypothetical protein [Zhihengliuella sp. ISTPL4]
MGDETTGSRSAPTPGPVRVVFDRHLDVVFASPLATALSAAFSVGNNLARSLFLNPEFRTVLEEWEQSASHLATMLRSNIRRFGKDPRFDDLVGELGALSPPFVEHWAGTEVAPRATDIVHFFHPMTGTQAYVCRLEPDGDERVEMRWSPADGPCRTALHALWVRTRQLEETRRVSAR